MNENELKSLKDLAPPPPSGKARARAFAAAMAAFDEASSDAAGQPAEKKDDGAPQGSAEVISLMDVSEQKRRRPMRAWPVNYKIAASIAVMMIAAPAAFYAMQQGKERPGDFAPVGDAGYSQAPASTAPAVKQQDLKEPAQPGRLELAKPAPVELPAGPSGLVSDDRSSAGKGRSEAKRDQLASSSDGPVTISASPELKREDEAAPSAPEQSVAVAPSPRPVTIARAPEPAKTTSFAGERRRQNEVGGAASAKPMAPAERKVSDASISVAPPAPPADVVVIDEEPENRDRFEGAASNPVKQVAAEPVSTFSIDVDTASYGFMRRALLAGHRPPKDSVRVEEMINYFPYSYPRPESTETPFQPTVTVTPSPWNPTNKLVHIGVKGYDIKAEQRPKANLVFLIDVSGSMSPADRLPLVKNAFRMLVEEMKPDDTIGIVTYASGTGIALEPTKVSEKRKILAAIDKLGAGGSTAGAQGVSDAYRLAEENFNKDGVNRIILATDGDFNVGVTSNEELKKYIEEKRKTGIFLSILGVGQDNYNDALMQTLAQNGNGTAAYVDTLSEARKVLVEESSSTLFTIAKDVKIQIEFNPAQVSEYRLIGYETRALKREDFNNDKVDAGDIGSGHTVTAIYEVTPVGAPKFVDDLRYQKPEQKPAAAAPSSDSGELGFLKLRYKLPKEDASKLITLPITRSLEKADMASAPEDVRFSVAVAGFGQLLRDLPYTKSFGYDDVIALAQGARGADPFGYRSEFLNLVRLAKSAR